jgi:hypothetical protein
MFFTKPIRALVCWSLAAVVDTALATAVGPAGAVRDRDLPTVDVAALGPSAVRPADSFGFGFLRAPIDVTLVRSTCTAKNNDEFKSVTCERMSQVVSPSRW